MQKQNTEQKAEIVGIQPPKPVTTTVTIKGLTSLLVNNIHPEDLKKGVRPEKDSKTLFEKALYPKQNGKHVIPSIMIKRSAIGAAHTFATSIPKTRARGAFDCPDDWIILDADKPTMHQVGGRNPNKRNVAIIITRPEFKNWKATFPITYDANGPLSLSEILNLINIAGWYVGIGAWRPSLNGIHGRFKVVENKK